MHHSHRQGVRTLLFLVAALATVILVPRLALLALGVALGLVLVTVVLSALAFWVLRRRVERFLFEHQASFSAARVVDGVIVEVR